MHAVTRAPVRRSASQGPPEPAHPLAESRVPVLRISFCLKLVIKAKQKKNNILFGKEKETAVSLSLIVPVCPASLKG